MLDLRLNLSSGDIQEVLSMKELVKVCEELDRLNLTFEVMQGATKGSYVVRSFDKGGIYLTCTVGTMTMTSKARGTYSSRSARGVINELGRIYGAPKAKAKEVSVIDSNIDKIVNYLKGKKGEVTKDVFGEVDDTETVYVTFTSLHHKVFICVLKDSNVAEYGVHVADMEDILEANDRDEEYDFSYKWYKHSGRLINQLRDACL